MRVLSQTEIDAILASMLTNTAVLPNAAPAQGAAAEPEKADPPSSEQGK